MSALSPTPRPTVSPHQVSELLARARRLSTTGPAADPTELAAYLADKADLLARITHPDHEHPPAARHQPATDPQAPEHQAGSTAPEQR